MQLNDEPYDRGTVRGQDILAEVDQHAARRIRLLGKRCLLSSCSNQVLRFGVRKTGLPAAAKKAAGKAKKKAKTAKPKQLVSMSAAEKDSCDQALPVNFRRNATGRRLIMKMLDRALGLDVEKFPSKPLFNSGDRLCRLKNCPPAVGLTWPEIRSRGPAYFECIFHRARSPDIYGIRVYEELRKVMQQLEASKRDAWILLIKGICELTQRAL